MIEKNKVIKTSQKTNITNFLVFHNIGLLVLLFIALITILVLILK